MVFHQSIHSVVFLAVSGPIVSTVVHNAGNCGRVGYIKGEHNTLSVAYINVFLIISYGNTVEYIEQYQ